MKVPPASRIAEKVRSALIKEPIQRERPLKAEEIWIEERNVIRARRIKRGLTETDTNGPMSGLCLSGGGVRSATFCLGVLQGLHRAGLLRAFDYLSTVSGGGFIGAWWTAWVHRNPTHKFPPAEKITFNRTSSPRHETAEWMSDCASAGVDPVHHLRLYSNYLTPRKGLLSADTWRAATVIARNLLLTLLVLLPFLFAVVLMADTYYVWQDTTWLEPDAGVLPFSPRLMLWLAPVLMAMGLLLVAVLAWLEFARVGALRLWVPYLSPIIVVVVGLSLYGIAGVTEFAVTIAGFVRSGPAGALFGAWAVLALVLFLRLRFVPPHDRLTQWRDLAGKARAREEEMRSRAAWWQVVFTVATCVLFLVLGVAGVGHEIVQSIRKSTGGGWLSTLVTDAGGWLALIAAFAGSVYTGFRTSPSASIDARGHEQPSLVGRLVLKFTPPTVLAVLLLLTALASHRAMRRVSGFAETVPSAVPILSIGLGIFVATCAVYAWQESGDEVFDRNLRRQIRTTAIVCWVMLLAVASCSVIGQSLIRSVRLNEVLVEVPVNRILWFMTGLSTFYALYSLWLSTGVENMRPGLCLFGAFTMLALVITAHVSGSVPVLIAFAFLGNVLAWIMTFGWLVDPNRISLHSFYKGRLVRAYLGASNLERGKETKYITEADHRDDMRLSDLASDVPAPYHLINATLNLVGGRDLKAAQRSSDQFLLSPLFCGSARTMYRRTAHYMSNQMTLGTAVAISGAAVSPTMGALSPTAALAALMTLLNVRLGYWAPTPNKWEWRYPGATLWPVYAIFELTSQTNELGSCCYLTDGGHFDNTGIYPLVERGCRYIMCVDCGADPGPCFEDLGTAIRRCRIDFGTEIEIDLGAAMPSNSDRKHFIIGKITYGAEHAHVLGMDDHDREGVLIVIKPQVLDVGESADVRQYRLQNNKFPQQITSDQWFDEAQFESYRKLGETSVRTFLAKLEPELKPFAEESFAAADVKTFFADAYAKYS
jgi:hypothetical protein